jgi:carbon monoxide dehydrogenase subunit G
MAIELEHSFAVPVPPEQAWEVLLDVARVAPCMPGAIVDEVDGDVVTGRIKVKVGPIALTYTGKATFTERDPAAHAVKVEAAGKETRGAGTASATVRASLTEEDGQTRVTVHTSLNVTGRPAQFGRGVMADVSGRLIEKFSANLAEQLASGDGPATSVRGGQALDARLTIPIRELNLSSRSSAILVDEGIGTVGELVSRTESDLLAIKNIGEKSVEEIEEKLHELGLALAGATPADTPAASSAAAGTDSANTASANGNGGRAGAAPEVSSPAGGASVGGGQDPDGAQPLPAAGLPRDEQEDDALNLLEVAAGPILKRALPAAAVTVLLVWLGFRLRHRARQGVG